METAEPLLEMRNIRKSYRGVQALRGVDFTLLTGEIHAIVGANGAGKSTLAKIICGALQPDGGVMFLKGERVQFRTVAEAIRAGVVAVYQERTLIPHLTGAENMLLGQEPAAWGVLDDRALRTVAAALLARLGLSLDLDRPVKELGDGERQLIDILKALRGAPSVIVLDEPTASLSRPETERLFALLQTFKARGIGTVFVSHRLDEVFATADRVTVLRDGLRVATETRGATSKRDVIRMMVNRDVSAERGFRGILDGAPPLLELRAFTDERFRDVNLVVRKSEVVGLAGVIGAGRTELLEAIVGFRRHRSGELWLRGRRTRIRAPLEAIARGLALVPEKRAEKALFERMTVRENLAAPALRRFAPVLVVDSRLEVAAVRRVVEALRIVTPHLELPVRQLSGGNKQKIAFGKWLLGGEEVEDRIFLFDEPTEGVDVGVKAEMWEIILDLARRGAGVLLASSELEELTYLCHRIYVMRHGRIVGEGHPNGLGHARLLRLMLTDERGQDTMAALTEAHAEGEAQ